MSEPFVCAYVLNGDGSGTRITKEALAGDRRPTWVHLSARVASARQWLAKEAALPDPMLAKALLAEDTRPRILPHENGLLLILRGVNLNENAEPDDMVSIRIWIERNRFISVQLRDLKGVAEMQDILQSGSGPVDVNDLLTFFIEGSIKRLSPVLADLADGVDELEEQILQMQLTGVREQIISIRRRTSIFNRFLSPQKDIVGRLSDGSALQLNDQLKRRLHEAHNDMTRFVEDLQAIRERAQSVQSEVTNILTARLNRNTYAFSIIAAIFLPLSFLTGLLGINIPGIPGEEDPEAFLVFCGILAGVVLAQVAIFKKLRWF